jgi:hypothetical protein
VSDRFTSTGLPPKSSVQQTVCCALSPSKAPSDNFLPVPKKTLRQTDTAQGGERLVSIANGPLCTPKNQYDSCSLLQFFFCRF